jgi:hypothetical protein
MKTTINAKRYTMTMVIIMLSVIGFAQSSKTPTITKTFEMNQPGTLNSTSSGGGIAVYTHDKAEVIVQAFVRKRGTVLSPQDPDVDEVL